MYPEGEKPEDLLKLDDEVEYLSRQRLLVRPNAIVKVETLYEHPPHEHRVVTSGHPSSGGPTDARMRPRASRRRSSREPLPMTSDSDSRSLPGLIQTGCDHRDRAAPELTTRVRVVR